ncbi:MAG: ABC transporter permease subunit, partial [Oscillospiraceae bacterium]
MGKYFIFSGLTSAAIGFTLNYAAYFAEIFRSGLLAIDKGQYEASKVLGLTKTQTMLKVIMPQMFRVTLPTVTSEIV